MRKLGLFSTAFEQICALKPVGELVINGLTRGLTAIEPAKVLEWWRSLPKLFFRVKAASSENNERKHLTEVSRAAKGQFAGL